MSISPVLRSLFAIRAKDVTRGPPFDQNLYHIDHDTLHSDRTAATTTAALYEPRCVGIPIPSSCEVNSAAATTARFLQSTVTMEFTVAGVHVGC